MGMDSSGTPYWVVIFGATEPSAIPCMHPGCELPARYGIVRAMRLPLAYRLDPLCVGHASARMAALRKDDARDATTPLPAADQT